MLLKEIRQALRLLAKNPEFTAIAALSLALGIGANSAIFSLADAILLRPLPVLKPRQVVNVTSETPSTPLGRISYPDYRDLRDKSRSFDGLVLYQFYTFGVTTSPTVTPQMRLGALVSDNFFRVLGVQPALGRGILPEEDKVSGRDPVIFLTHDYWRFQFANDTSAIGRTIRLNGIDFTIVAVLPENFTTIDQWVRPAFYVPLTMAQRLRAAKTDPLEDRKERSWQVKGRLKPGVSREAAQSELAGIAKNLEKAYPETNRDRTVAVRTELQERIREDPPDATLVTMLMALVGLVLIIACANIANLFLARGSSRSREIAIRLAIGVGRLRLVRQLFIESLLLALLGGILGVGFAYGGIRFLQTIDIPTDIPVVITAQLDYRVFLFSLLAAVASALVFGLAPAWQALRTDLVSALKCAGLAASAGRRTIGRNALVISQIALALVLLVATGMLLDGFQKALALNPGFRTDHIMGMEFDTSFVRYTEDQSRDFYGNLIDRARALPGVRSATLSAAVPLYPNQSGETVIPDGYQFPKGEESIFSFASSVDEQYFDTMGTPIHRGRAFTKADKTDSRRVVIVNHAFADKYWPQQDPIGKRIRLKDRNGPLVEVVGVAKTGRYLFIGEPPTPFVYFPYAQDPKTRMSLLVETYGDPAAIAAPLRDLVRSLDENMPIYNARTLSDFYQQRAISIMLMILQLVATMGFLGLTLALVGLYGLIAYSVSRRTQEIGIRIALGAHRSDVLRMVLRQGFLLSIIGVGIGFAASVAVQRILTIGLVGLGTLNSATLVIVPIVLILVTMAACYLPARRASQVDPIRALRYE
jgi:predicted permease